MRQLDEKTMVGPQIAPSDVAALKDAGVTMIINNRPDEEDAGQPRSAEIAEAAKQAGIDYRWVPVARGMGPSDVDLMHEALDAAGDGKVFAFCRSGNRSTLIWALARCEQGASREEVERAAANAGFSLDPIAHLL